MTPNSEQVKAIAEKWKPQILRSLGGWEYEIDMDDVQQHLELCITEATAELRKGLEVTRKNDEYRTRLAVESSQRKDAEIDRLTAEVERLKRELLPRLYEEYRLNEVANYRNYVSFDTWKASRGKV